MKAGHEQGHFVPKKGGISFFEFMLQNLDFFVRCISVHYPFTVAEIEEHWDVLSPGTAHYPVYLFHTEKVYGSELGLCFNQNIRWTSELKDRWKIGFNNPYEGYYAGLGADPVQYDDRETLRSKLPLNLNEHWWAGEMIVMDSYQRQGLLDDYLACRYPTEGESREMKAEQEYSRLSLENFQKLYAEIGNWMVYNRSIWYNTLYYELKEKDVYRLLRLRRYQVLTLKNY